MRHTSFLLILLFLLLHCSGTPPFVPGDLKRIADLGFTHVRIPIRWERDNRSMASSPYTLYPEFLKTIQNLAKERGILLLLLISMEPHVAFSGGGVEVVTLFS